MYLGGTTKKGFRFFAPCFGLAAIEIKILIIISKKDSIYLQSLVVVGSTKMYVVQPDLRLFLPDLFDSLAAVI